MGIRYKTPVGPVRFDLGYNFNPTRYPIQLAEQGGDAAAYQRLFQYWTDILMRRILHFTMYLLFLLPAAVIPVFAGEIIDGVVVTVNHKPIFRSDWDEAVCYELFMQRKPVAQVSESDRVTALQRLIDRQLLKAQMGDAHSLQPSEEDLQTRRGEAAGTGSGGQRRSRTGRNCSPLWPH